MATREDLERKIDKLEVNMDRTDRIVNGTETEDVMVDGGVLVPSIRKWQKELEEEYGIPSETLDRAEDAASRAESAADSAAIEVAGLRNDLANPDKVAALVSGATIYVGSVAELEALSASRNGQIVYIAGRITEGDGGEGVFRWDASDLSASVSADPQQGFYVAPTSAPSGASGAWVRSGVSEIYPEWWGAFDSSPDASAELQACFTFASDTGYPINGRGRKYNISDSNGAVPESVGSYWDDFGLYAYGDFTLRNIQLNMIPGVQYFTTCINLYSGPSSKVLIENVQLFGNGSIQSPSGPVGREDGGLHGIRTYGQPNNDTDNTRSFGSLTLRDVTCDEMWTDGIYIRSMTYDDLLLERVKVFRAGRNGITINSKTKAYIRDLVANYNGTRAEPRSGLHIEPNNIPEEIGEYEGFDIDGLECNDNGNRGFQIDFRGDGSILSRVSVKRFEILRNPRSLRVTSTDEALIKDLYFEDGVVDDALVSHLFGGVNPLFETLRMKNVDVLGRIRIESKRDAPAELVHLELRKVGGGAATDPHVDFNVGTFPKKIFISVEELEPTTSHAFAVRVSSVSDGVSDVNGDQCYVSVKSSTSPRTMQVRGPRYIHIDNTYDVKVDSRISSTNLLKVTNSTFLGREDGQRFIRAENAKAVLMSGCYFRDVTESGAVPLGIMNQLGTGVVEAVGCFLEDSEGAVTAYTL